MSLNAVNLSSVKQVKPLLKSRAVIQNRKQAQGETKWE
jgi:hypothetical protein